VDVRTEPLDTKAGIFSIPTADRSAASGPTVDTIRVLIVGASLYTRLLAGALGQDQNFDPVEASCEEAAAAVSNHRPHVAVIDAGSDREPLKGADIARQVRLRHPRTQVVLLLQSKRPESVLKAFRAGANGILYRGESSHILKKCIYSVHKGQVWASSGELRLMLETLRTALPSQLVDFSGRPLLTNREQDVVRGIAEGLTNKEIAEYLKLSPHTVKNTVNRVFDKLGVSSRVEVVLYAVSQVPQGGRQMLASDDFVFGQCHA